MNRSQIKTWFKRNGFKADYGAFRSNWTYCNRDGRHYRIRNNEQGTPGFVVDTSDLDFDRWANSTEIHAQPIAEFINSNGLRIGCAGIQCIRCPLFAQSADKPCREIRYAVDSIRRAPGRQKITRQSKQRLRLFSPKLALLKFILETGSAIRLRQQNESDIMIIKKLKKIVVDCPYCNENAKLVGGLAVYPHRQDLKDKVFYLCTPCNAYVGCHPGTINPLGRLANAELRKAKMAAHAVFDPIWKTGEKKRGSAYAWLSDATGIPKKDCHIGMMDVADCLKVVRACSMNSVPQNQNNIG